MRRCWLFLFVPALAAAAPPAVAPLVDDYTAVMFRFDDAGAEARDDGPLARSLPLGAAKLAPGRFGSALDARTGGLHVPFSSMLTATDQLTIEAWVFVAGRSPDAELMRLAYRSSCYGLYTDASGRSLTYYLNLGGQWVSLRGELPAEQWVHLAGTYDGRSMRLYLDGEVVSEQTASGEITDSGQPFEIGGEVREQRRFFNGLIDEVKVSVLARTEFATPATFAPTTTVEPIAVPTDAVAPVAPEITAGRAAAALRLDGRLDDAVWSTALRLPLRDSAPGTTLTQATEARLAWDDESLYVGVTCQETATDRLRRETTVADGPVWSDDCIELFLRPPGDPSYYHLAANSLGILYDSRQTGGAAEAAWQSGAEVAAAVDDGFWSVEWRVPWSAFGQPSLDRPWRFNVTRARPLGRELSSWAAVGGRFHSPGKFGILRLGAEPVAPDAGTTLLVGQVHDVDGKPMAGLPVSTAVGLSRTDAWGRFRAAGLPAGDAVVMIQTPRYAPLAVRVKLVEPVEQVVLPPVTAIDPNRLTAPVTADGRRFRLFSVPPLDDLDPDRLPAAELEDAPLTAFAAAGEVEPVGTTIVAVEPLARVEVAVTPLHGPGGAMIGLADLDLRLARRLFTRVHYARPPEDVAPMTRYLLRPEPFAMAAGTFRRVHLKVTVPATAPAGAYRGELLVTADGEERRLPIEFDVLPLRLAALSRHYGLYYRTALTAETEALVRRELADMRAHGADRLFWRPQITYRPAETGVAIDYSGVIAHVELMLEYGYVGPYIVLNGFERLAAMTDGESGDVFRATAKEAILGLRRLASERDWPELVVTHMDEVFGEDRLDRYIALAEAVRQVPEQRLYITFHNRPVPGNAERIARIDPFVDIRCYHGHSIDEWLAAGHTLDELAAELDAAGDEAWCYYNPRSIEVTPEWARLTNGYWLWLTPLTTHIPWAYNSWRGDPLDDEDGYDFGYAFPVGDEIVPTRLWEGYREGVDDLRYLSTLEALVERARAEQRAEVAAEAAAGWLRSLREELLALPLEPQQSALVIAISQRYGAADYDRWRRDCAAHIAALAAGLGDR